ncbi:MAG: ATP-binding protein [Calditrichia bacterium]
MKQNHLALLVSPLLEFRIRYAEILEQNGFRTLSQSTPDLSVFEKATTPDLCFIDNRENNFPYDVFFEFLNRTGVKTIVIHTGNLPENIPSESHYVYRCDDENVPLISLLLNLNEFLIRRKSRVELAAMLIHDVRSPLHSLMAYIELLMNQSFGVLNEGQKNFLEKSMILGDQVLDMMEDINEIYKTEQYAFSIDKAPFSIAEVLDQALLSLWIQTDQKQQKITKTIESGLPTVNGDGYQIQRIFTNLIQNAIKYCPPKSSININIHRSSERVLEVRVTDNGGGIPEENLKSIFRKSFRVNQSAEEQKGYGLGLYICKIIIKAHGGTIRAENNVSGGVSFIFTLPIN